MILQEYNRKEGLTTQNVLNSIRGALRRFSYAPIRSALPVLAMLSLILNLLLEVLGRRSIPEALLYLFSSPLLFFANVLIILFTLALCLLARRRLTVLLITTTLWLALGVTNCIVLSYRSSPLSAIDLLIVRSALGMATVYFTVIQLVLIILLIAAFIALLLYLFIKSPRCRVSYRKSILSVAVIGIAASAVFALTIPADATGYESGELADAYNSYGFAYCFTRSLISQGVERPEDYSREKADEIADALRSESDTLTADTEITPDEVKKPNIIFVQLESFFDVKHINGLEFSEDPTPNFTALKQNGVSGFLRVPHVGGGTANVEFEVLTGMNLDHFGFGEYPYTTVLKSRACESLAANLKSVGYAAHAIHNHIATFYDRHIVYASLGFDTFTPVELMQDVTRNPLGWVKDEVLTAEIVSALDSTAESDFVFAVSVQGHGKYPDKPLEAEQDYLDDGYYSDDEDFIEEDSKIKISGIEDESVYSQYRYYVNQIYEMDAFIGELCDALDKRGEPCVAVFYGDHLPAIPLTEDMLANGDVYKTEYAVWSNVALEGAWEASDVNSLDRELEAYLLSAYIQQLCGMNVGDITMLHQYGFDTGEEYDKVLRTLEYAQLYDTDKVEYYPAEMTFGTREITVDSYTMSGNTLYIKGCGFNEYSTVKLDGIRRAAELIDGHTLMVENVFFAIGEPEVVQVADDGTELVYAKKNMQ